VVTSRAICCIQGSFGWAMMPAMSTRRLSTRMLLTAHGHYLPYKSRNCCRGSRDKGLASPRALASRRTLSPSRSCERIIHGAPLQGCCPGNVPSQSMRHIVEGLADKTAAASLIVTSPRSARSPSRLGSNPLMLPQRADPIARPTIAAAGRLARTVQGRGDRFVW